MQVQCKTEALLSAEAQLAALQADLDFNMRLLEGRDEELVQCEHALLTMRSELAAKEELITQMQQAMAEAEQSAWWWVHAGIIKS